MNLQWEETETNKRWELVELVHKPLGVHRRVVHATVNAKRPRRRRSPRYFIARLVTTDPLLSSWSPTKTTSKAFHCVDEAKGWAVALVQLGSAS